MKLASWNHIVSEQLRVSIMHFNIEKQKHDLMYACFANNNSMDHPGFGLYADYVESISK